MPSQAFVFCAAALTCTFALAGPATPSAPSAPYDPLAASFERLLNPAPAAPRSSAPAQHSADADPLRAHLSALLWTEPSYHLPTRVAQLTLASQRRP